MLTYPLTALAVILALVVYLILGTLVGAARGKWNVPAPLSSGHPEFDKRYRVHMNTLEQLALFLPGMLLAAPVLGDATTAAIGFVWSLGRILYARAYFVDPARRSLGFALTAMPSLILLGAGGFGAVRTLLG